MGLLKKSKDKDSEGSVKSGGILAGIKGKKGDNGSGLRDNERLESVVDESVPGHVTNCLQATPAFALPDGKGHVILGLLTQDRSFGGLSLATKGNPDKGTLVNQLTGGSIEYAATRDMLDENILGLIPDANSLKELREFSIIRKARFTWTVVTIDPATGNYVSFWVPPTDEVLFRTGELFDSAVAVANGELELSQVVDLTLIDMMIEILGHTEDDYGIDGLNDAMAENGEIMKEYVGLGELPPAKVFYTSLLRDFPALKSTFSDLVDGQTQEDEITVEDASVEPETATATENPVEEISDEALPDEEDPAAVFGIDDDPFGADLDDNAVLASGSHASGEESENSETSVGRHASDRDGAERLNEVVGRGQVDSSGMTDDDLGRLAEEVAARVLAQSTPPMGEADARLAQATAVDDRSFSADETNNEYLRQFRGREVELNVEAAPLAAALGYDLPVLTLPADIPTTPWLAEQLDVLVSNYNDKLVKIWQDDIAQTRSEYVTMLSTEADQILEDVNVDNRNSPFYEVAQAIAEDDRITKSKIPEVVNRHNQEIREDYEKRREEFAERKRLEALNNFDHANRSKHERDLKETRANVAAQQEEMIEEQISKLNNSVSVEAHNRFAVSTNIVLESLAPIVETRRKALDDMFKQFDEDIRKYLSDHREEDLHQANVERDRLERDTRIQTVIEEANEKVEQARSEAAAQVASYQASRKAEFEQMRNEMEQVKRAADLKAKGAEERAREAEERSKVKIREVEKQLVESDTIHEESVARYKEQAEIERQTALSLTQKESGVTSLYLTIMFILIALSLVIGGAVSQLIF